MPKTFRCALQIAAMLLVDPSATRKPIHTSTDALGWDMAQETAMQYIKTQNVPTSDEQFLNSGCAAWLYIRTAIVLSSAA